MPQKSKIIIKHIPNRPEFLNKNNNRNKINSWGKILIQTLTLKIFMIINKLNNNNKIKLKMNKCLLITILTKPRNFLRDSKNYQKKLEL